MDHPILPWIVKQSVRILHRFLIYDDGLSTSHIRCGNGPLPGLAGFGENVSFKAHGKHFTAKADPSFAPVGSVGIPIQENTFYSPREVSSKRDHQEDATFGEIPFRHSDGLDTGA